MAQSEYWYQPSDYRALTTNAVFAFTSFISVFTLMSVLLWPVITGRTSNKKPFLKTQTGWYFACLLTADMLHSIPGILCIRWLSVGHIYTGPLCTFQGFINHFAIVSIAFWITVIAIHSLCVLLFNARTSNRVCLATIIGTWLAIGFVMLIGATMIHTPERGPFYGITGSWCWITPQYRTERFWLQPFFLFTASVISMIVYTLIFFRLRGNLVTAGYRIYIIRTEPSRAWDLRDGRAALESETMRLAWQLMWYPLAYTVIIIPLAVMRIPPLAVKVPPLAVVAAGLVMTLSGIMDTVLFIITRHVALPKKLRRDPVPKPSTVLTGFTTQPVSGSNGQNSYSVGLSTLQSKAPEATMLSLGDHSHTSLSAHEEGERKSGELLGTICVQGEENRDPAHTV